MDYTCAEVAGHTGLEQQGMLDFPLMPPPWNGSREGWPGAPTQHPPAHHIRPQQATKHRLNQAKPGRVLLTGRVAGRTARPRVAIIPCFACVAAQGKVNRLHILE